MLADDLLKKLLKRGIPSDMISITPEQPCLLTFKGEPTTKKRSKRIAKKMLKRHIVRCLEIGPASKKMYEKMKFSQLLKRYEYLKTSENYECLEAK